MRCQAPSLPAWRRASLAALALFGVALLGCAPRVVPSAISCTSDQDCAASARCEEGVCQAVDDDAGFALVDAGREDSGPPPVDAGHDGGPRSDAGRDAGGPFFDGGTPTDAGIVDASGADAGGGPPDAGAGEDAGACGGCPAPLQRAPLEVCGDGYDNDCDGVVDETPCGGMQRINIPQSPLPAGYSLRIPVSAALLGNSTGDDVRVWRTVPATNGVSFVELHRVLDPDEDWSDPHTLWFALPDALTQPSAGEYRLTWGPQLSSDVGGPPLSDERQVFPFADFFELPSEGGGPGWSFDENPDNNDIDVVDGALTVVTANELDGRPSATADFSPLSGQFVFDVRFHWEGVDGDDPEDYAWRLVLGDDRMGDAAPTDDELEPDGIGPNLLWSGGLPNVPMPFHHALAVDGQPPNPDAADDGRPLLGTSGVTSARVRIEGDALTGTFRVVVNGQPYPASGAFQFADGSVTLLSRLRVYTSELTINAARGFSPARFEHVILRKSLPTEPTLTVTPHAPCP